MVRSLVRLASARGRGNGHDVVSAKPERGGKLQCIPRRKAIGWPFWGESGLFAGAKAGWLEKWLTNSVEVKTKKVEITGSFLRQSTEMMTNTSKAKLKSAMNSVYLANFMAVVVLVDAYCTVVDIDATAAREKSPEVFRWISDLCLAARPCRVLRGVEVFYTVEVFAWLLIFGLEILRDWMMLLDLFIVLCGWGEKVIETLADGGLGFRIAVLRALRLVRIFRLMRLLPLGTPSDRCDDMINADELLAEKKFASCDGTCQRAMSSVMDANLLLFKTVIAGDSWGEIPDERIAVPVIQEHPATAVIFVGSLLTLVFGVLNLIVPWQVLMLALGKVLRELPEYLVISEEIMNRVAVVVDTFADARLNDVENLAQEMEDEIEHDRTALAKLFARIDKDGSGQLTLQELIEGARDDSGFQSRLRVMDIDEHDLEQLFQMIDVDQSGTIEVAEFIGPLSRWAHDSKTAPRFIKYNMIQTMHLQEDLYELSVDCFNQLASRIDDLSLQIRGDPLFADLLNNTLELEAEPSDPPTEPHTSPMEPREPGDASPSEAPASSESEKPEAAQGTIELDSCNPSPSPSRQVSHGLPHERLDRMDRQISGAAHHRGVDQPRASPRDMEFLAPKSVEREARESSNAIEKMLESAMAKLESKLEQLLVEARKTPMDRHVLPSEDLTAFADAKLRQRRKKGKKMLHPEAFRSMYMNHGRRLSLVELPSAQRRQSSHDAVARPRRRSLSADGLQGPPDNAVGRTITATDLLKEAKTHGNFQDSPESRRDSRRDSPVKPI
ncbi:Calcium-dependent protein kinase 1 (PbCDPK1) [Durusdinium trenchii]|uniref:Calcium-dependent protein kinase 1 (PbCDPK1) n=1 Tax=Durusdinium trenchii TaxID=1381693 RepID=A0ABP0KCS2_9DINO